MNRIILIEVITNERQSDTAKSCVFVVGGGRGGICEVKKMYGKRVKLSVISSQPK